MRKMMILALVVGLCGCVDDGVARNYAQRAHPECERFSVESHMWQPESQTEISMTCPTEEGGEARRSITIKCIFGWGFFSDTTCHENN